MNCAVCTAKMTPLSGSGENWTLWCPSCGSLSRGKTLTVPTKMVMFRKALFDMRAHRLMGLAATTPACPP